MSPSPLQGLRTANIHISGWCPPPLMLRQQPEWVTDRLTKYRLVDEIKASRHLPSQLSPLEQLAEAAR